MKKEVKNNIICFLDHRYNEITIEIRKNRYLLNDIVKKQTLLKRTRAELDKLRNEIKRK